VTLIRKPKETHQKNRDSVLVSRNLHGTQESISFDTQKRTTSFSTFLCDTESARKKEVCGDDAKVLGRF
jgi:hypothetical protein